MAFRQLFSQIIRTDASAIPPDHSISSCSSKSSSACADNIPDDISFASSSSNLEAEPPRKPNESANDASTTISSTSSDSNQIADIVQQAYFDWFSFFQAEEISDEQEEIE